MANELDLCTCPDDCGAPPSTEMYCNDEVDNDCDGWTDCDDPDCPAPPCDRIPTVSEWGLIALALALLAGAKVYFGRRRLASRVGS